MKPRNRRLMLIAVLLLIAAPAIASTGGAEGEISPWERLFLRAHPLLVHFPIALLLAAVPLELLHMLRSWFVRRFRAYRARLPVVSPAALACVVLGAIGAGLSVWSGWENAEHEPHGRSVAQLIELHRWLALAALTCATLALFTGVWVRFVDGAPRTLVGVYRTLLLAGALVVSIAGHLGGSVVRGEGYLMDPLREAILGPGEGGASGDGAAPADSAQPGEIAESLVFAEPAGTGDAAGFGSDSDRLSLARVAFERDIQPIFEARCVECHGRTNAYGESRLRLHEFEVVSAHIGTTMIIPGFASSSELYRRVALPADDWDVMPADGDPLTPAQIAAIGAWIESLAPSVPDGPLSDRATGEGAAAEGQTPDVAATSGSGPEPVTPGDEPELLAPDPVAIDRAIERLRALGAYADRTSLDGELVRVSFAPLGPRCTDGTLDALAGLEPVLAELDLTSSSISDSGGAILSRFIVLRTLTLSRTSIGSEFVRALADLPALRSLTLSSTRIGGDSLPDLARMRSLHALYVWNTHLTPGDIASLREAMPSTRVDAGEIALPDAPGPPAGDGSQATNSG